MAADSTVSPWLAGLVSLMENVAWSFTVYSQLGPEYTIRTKVCPPQFTPNTMHSFHRETLVGDCALPTATAFSLLCFLGSV